MEVIMPNLHELEAAIPVAPLKIVATESAVQLADRVNQYLIEFRKTVNNLAKNDPAFQGYVEDNYLAKASCPRFGTGEGKGVLHESIRGKDVFFLVDVCNHSIT